ncbi:unnamed protein product [Ceutorhynchus assimilis]|uniref:Homeobox domain-containing protein n=1 Tax=Ceutorhynchus assimilis TaxID=467358 RepID=A0A9N9MDK4_9CUCU|nr:unnamed protein product [Ceutorhynchus assimilis]
MDSIPRLKNLNATGAGTGAGVKKERKNFPKRTIQIMQQWLFENRYDPYPDKDDKVKLCREAGVTMLQLSYWLANARRRKLPEMLRLEGRNSKDYTRSYGSKKIRVPKNTKANMLPVDEGIEQGAGDNYGINIDQSDHENAETQNLPNEDFFSWILEEDELDSIPGVNPIGPHADPVPLNQIALDLMVTTEDEGEETVLTCL